MSTIFKIVFKLCNKEWEWSLMYISDSNEFIYHDHQGYGWESEHCINMTICPHPFSDIMAKVGMNFVFGFLLNIIMDLVCLMEFAWRIFIYNVNCMTWPLLIDNTIPKWKLSPPPLEKPETVHDFQEVCIIEGGTVSYRWARGNNWSDAKLTNTKCTMKSQSSSHIH